MCFNYRMMLLEGLHFAKWALDDFAPIKLQTGVGKENSDYIKFKEE